MNKNFIITALLVAVSCQPVSAVSFFSSGATESFGDSFQRTIRTMVGLSVLAGVGVTVLGIAAYKYATKEKVWVEGNCIKFKKRGLFGRIEQGSICFKSPEEATAAHKVFEKGNVFGGFSRMQEVAKTQCAHPSFEWSPVPMTAAEAQKEQN